MIIEGCPEVLKYLPDVTGKQQLLPERDYFWTVVYTLCHDNVEAYIKTVEEKRRNKPNLQDK